MKLPFLFILALSLDGGLSLAYIFQFINAYKRDVFDYIFAGIAGCGVMVFFYGVAVIYATYGDKLL